MYFFSQSLAYYRGGESVQVRKELQEIIRAKDSKGSQSNRSFLSIVTSGEFWRPFSCVGVLFILFRLSGFSILSHYTAPFLERARINVDPLVGAVIIGIFRVVSSIIAFAIFSATSKRTAFIVGGIMSIFGMLTGQQCSCVLTSILPHQSLYSCHLFASLRNNLTNFWWAAGQGMDTTLWLNCRNIVPSSYLWGYSHTDRGDIPNRHKNSVNWSGTRIAIFGASLCNRNVPHSVRAV